MRTRGGGRGSWPPRQVVGYRVSKPSDVAYDKDMCEQRRARGRRSRWCDSMSHCMQANNGDDGKSSMIYGLHSYDGKKVLWRGKVEFRAIVEMEMEGEGKPNWEKLSLTRAF